VVGCHGPFQKRLVSVWFVKLFTQRALAYVPNTSVLDVLTYNAPSIFKACLPDDSLIPEQLKLRWL